MTTGLALIGSEESKPEIGDEWEYFTCGIHVTGVWFPLVGDPSKPPQPGDLNALGKDGWMLRTTLPLTAEMMFAIFMRARRRIQTL